jgi:adenine-specific DNA-methyltransferase
MSDPSSTPQTLNDLLPVTPDGRAERLAELKRLFPDLFTNEGRLNPDELKQLVEPNEVHETERYEFKWYGKAASKREAFTPTTATLVYDEARSVNPDKADGNMIIEGENLETLKLLLNAYREQVKCIYIDPPYNTGKDFIYRDNYKKDKPKYWEEIGAAENGVQLESNPETSGRYHSDWMSFIHERLLAARQLLKREGVILISIDDHELVNLRRVADEVFGEENHVANVIWEKGRKNDSKLVSVGHEYIVCYAKDKLRLGELGIKWREAKPGASEIHEEYLKLRAKHDKDHLAVEQGLNEFYGELPSDHPSKKLTRYKRVDSLGVWRDDNMSWPGGNGPTYDVIHPITGKPCAVPPGGWRYSTIEKMNAAIASGRVEFRSDHSEPPIRKTYLVRVDGSEEDAEEDEEGDASIQVAGTYFYRSALPASRELDSLFGTKVFNNSKDHEVLARWFKYVASGEEKPLLVDFFGGSGSAAHACLDLLQERFTTRWIVVQIPERVETDTSTGSNAIRLGLKTISAITIERVKRVIEGYGENPRPIPDAGFKVYKLQKSNFPRCEFKPDSSADEETNVAALRRYIDEKEAAFFLTLDGKGEQAVFDEVLLKNGFQLHYSRSRREDFPDNTVFEVRDPRRTALVCLAWNESIKDGTIKRLREIAEAGEAPFFICLERSLSTTSKWNLRHFLGKHFNAF